MFEVEYVVVVSVIQYCVFECDYLGVVGGQGYVWCYCVIGIEIDEVVLYGVDLGVFVQWQQGIQVGVYVFEFGGGGVDGGDQVWVVGGQVFEGGVIQVGGQVGVWLGVKGGEMVDEVYCRFFEMIGGMVEK